MHFREITDKDYENLAALAIQVWLNTYAQEGLRPEISQFVLKEFTPEKFKIIDSSPDHILYVATHEKHLIGFITLGLNSHFKSLSLSGYEIQTLYIHDHFKRQGVGSMLLEKVSSSHGSKSWLTTWIHNTSALKFYKINGFLQVGTTWFNLSGEKHENIVLAKS